MGKPKRVNLGSGSNKTFIRHTIRNQDAERKIADVAVYVFVYWFSRDVLLVSSLPANTRAHSLDHTFCSKCHISHQRFTHSHSHGPSAVISMFCCCKPHRSRVINYSFHLVSECESFPRWSLRCKFPKPIWIRCVTSGRPVGLRCQGVAMNRIIAMRKCDSNYIVDDKSMGRRTII